MYLLLASWGLGMSSCSVAVALGCTVSNVKSATELMPLLFVPQLLFAGFFIRTSDIPIFLRWAQYLCSLKYALNLAIIAEFNASNDNCQESSAAEKNCKTLLKSNDINSDQFYVYIIILFVLFAGFRILGATVLVHKAKRFY